MQKRSLLYLSIILLPSIYAQEECTKIIDIDERVACYDDYFLPKVKTQEKIIVPDKKSQQITFNTSTENPKVAEQSNLKTGNVYKIIGIKRDKDLKLIISTKEFNLKLQETLSNRNTFGLDDNIELHKGLIGFFISKKGLNKKYRVVFVNNP